MAEVVLRRAQLLNWHLDSHPGPPSPVLEHAVAHEWFKWATARDGAAAPNRCHNPSMAERSRSRVAAALLASTLMVAGCSSETSSGEPPQSLGAEVQQSDDVTAEGESPADSQDLGPGPTSSVTDAADGSAVMDAADGSAVIDPADGSAPYASDVGERLWPGSTWPGLLRFVVYHEDEGWTAPTEQDDLFVPTGSWVLVSGSGFAPFSAVGLERVSGDWERLEELGESATVEDLSFTDLEAVTADDRRADSSCAATATTREPTACLRTCRPTSRR